MVCHGPDPPDTTPQELSPPPVHDLVITGEDSEEETGDYVGYQPLPQGPDGFQPESAPSDDDMEDNPQQMGSPQNVFPIQPMDQILSREVWGSPRPTDPIDMDTERVEQVMTAMANFVLPPTSIPEWAKSISEEQWKQTLKDRIEKLKNNI